MSEYEVDHSGRSPLGQRVEFRSYIQAGHSVAERRAAVVVSGKIVYRGWVSDGQTYDEFTRILRQGWIESDRHICRKGGRYIGPNPDWAMPGEMVKLADEENWGRVETLYRCCHTYVVRLEEFGDQEAGVRSFPLEALENAWDAYPSNLPPKGYPVPKRPGGPRRVRA